MFGEDRRAHRRKKIKTRTTLERPFHTRDDEAKVIARFGTTFDTCVERTTGDVD